MIKKLLIWLGIMCECGSMDFEEVGYEGWKIRCKKCGRTI